MTKKQINLLQNLLDKYQDAATELANTSGKTPCIAEFDQENSDNVNYHCYKCGAEGTVNAANLSCCPNCGEKIETPSEYSKRVRYIVEEEDSFAMLEGQSSVWYGERSKDSEFALQRIAIFKDGVMNFFENEGDWVKRTPREEVYRCYRDNSVCNLSDAEVEALIKKFNSFFSPKGVENSRYYDNNSYATFDFKRYPSVYRLVKVNQDYNRCKKNSKPSKANAETFKFPKLDENELLKKVPDRTYFKEENEGMLVHRTCICCGHKITSKFNAREYYDSCPHCGVPLVCSRRNNKTFTESSSLFFFEDREECMALYLYEVYYEFHLIGNTLQKCISSVTPYAAVTFNGENFKFFKHSDGDAVECPCSQIHDFFKPKYYGRNDTQFEIQTPNEILKILTKWNFGRTGFFALLGFDPENPESLSTEVFKPFLQELYHCINLMHIYNSFKGIELLAKCGMTNFTKDLGAKLAVPSFIKKKETTPVKILGISKAQFKELRKANVSLLEFIQYKEILNYDPNARFIYCQRFFNRYNETPLCIDLLKLDIKKINMKEINDYCDNLDQYQCMDIVAGMQEWRDYLNMSKELKADLNNRSVLFPNSLKLEHDRAVRKVGSLRNYEIVKNFKQSVEKYKYLEYEDEKHDFFIKVPSSQEELYEEGRQLHHCVGSYVNSVASGSSLILFIRKKDDPDTPLCTIEVRGNRIVQARTRFNNPAYSVPGVRNFIAAWKKARHLEMYNQ